MENATKALLIAAGILLIIMIISALVIFWDEMAGYFTEKHEATMIEQLVEFNNKFSNYNGKTIRGNELLSIMNRIIDYNNYQSDMLAYERIAIIIDLKGHHEELKYKGENGSNTIIKSSIITNTGAEKDNTIKNIAETSSNLSATLGISDVKLQKLSAHIDSIVDDDVVDARSREDYKKYRAQLLTRILGYDVEIDDSRINDIKKATYQYYQFTQFKRAMFECTDIKYNEQNGRINEMRFEVVLETDASGEHIKSD